jgi:hypothetical protein
MNYIDIFLVDRFEKQIIDSLGIHAVAKIKDRLFERHGMSLSQAIMDFEIFESVLYEYFGSGNKGVIKDCINSVCIPSQSENTIEIKDEELEKTIFESMMDDDKKSIISKTMKSPMTLKEMVMEIQENSTEQKAFEKVNSLITNRILMESPKDDHMKETYYYNVINGMTINYEDGIKITMSLKENLQHSMILQQIIR